MLLTDARDLPARIQTGDLITMEHQNRDQWDSTLIAEGAALITDAMRHRQVWPYQLQAAIPAVHNGALAIPKLTARRSPRFTPGWSGSPLPRQSGSAESSQCESQT
jgi:hypothetical protein